MSGKFAFEQAVIGILTAILYADEQLADAELAWWARMRESHPLFAAVPPGLFDPMLAHAQQKLLGRPWAQAISEWAAEVPRQHAELVYRLAVDLQFADGDCARQESRMTAHLSHALGIPMDRSTHIFETALAARLED